MQLSCDATTARWRAWIAPLAEARAESRSVRRGEFRNNTCFRLSTPHDTTVLPPAEPPPVSPCLNCCYKTTGKDLPSVSLCAYGFRLSLSLCLSVFLRVGRAGHDQDLHRLVASVVDAVLRPGGQPHPVPHEDFSDLYGEMSGRGETASALTTCSG